MQTFLPFSDFDECARVLDSKRLNKQIRESKQILCAIIADQPARRERQRKWGKFYPNHPAVKMWRGHQLALIDYTLAMIEEFRRRGGQDRVNVQRWFERVASMLSAWGYSKDTPWWLGEEELHASHRSNLLKKEPDWYCKFDWTEGDGLPYWWPTHHDKV